MGEGEGGIPTLTPLQLSVTTSLPRPGKDCRIGWKGDLGKGSTISELALRLVCRCLDWLKHLYPPSTTNINLCVSISFSKSLFHSLLDLCRAGRPRSSNHPNYHSSALITKQSPNCCLHFSPPSCFQCSRAAGGQAGCFRNIFLLEISHF